MFTSLLDAGVEQQRVQHTAKRTRQRMVDNNNSTGESGLDKFNILDVIPPAGRQKAPGLYIFMAQLLDEASLDASHEYVLMFSCLLRASAQYLHVL